MSGFGEKAIRLAARVADGYVSTKPDADAVALYREAGGGDRLTQGGLKACWGPDEAQARTTTHRLRRNEEIGGEATQLLPLPRHYAQPAKLISEDMMTAPCGPDLHVHLGAVRQYAEAGFDEVYMGQVGPDQDGFFEFYAREVLPRLRGG